MTVTSDHLAVANENLQSDEPRHPGLLADPLRSPHFHETEHNTLDQRAALGEALSRE
jgi:hypothetical protein